MQYIRKTLRSNVPMLAVTANVFSENRSDAIRAGANEFFTKPILAALLMEALNKYRGEDHE